MYIKDNNLLISIVNTLNGLDLTSDNLEKIIQLIVPSKINSLEGIQHLTNLKSLIVLEGNISELWPLRFNHNLEELTLKNCNIDDISIIAS